MDLQRSLSSVPLEARLSPVLDQSGPGFEQLSFGNSAGWRSPSSVVTVLGLLLTLKKHFYRSTVNIQRHNIVVPYHIMCCTREAFVSNTFCALRCHRLLADPSQPACGQTQ